MIPFIIGIVMGILLTISFIAVIRMDEFTDDTGENEDHAKR